MRLLFLYVSFLISSVSVSVSGHGALYIPTPRNSIDRLLPQFENGKSSSQPCTCADGLGGPNASVVGCNRGLRGDADGQSCLWWSQGCSIGCEVCATASDPTKPITGM